MFVAFISRMLLAAIALATAPLVHGQSVSASAAANTATAGEDIVSPTQAYQSSSDLSAGSGIAASAVEPSRPFLHRVVPAGDGPQDLTAPQKFEMSFRSRVGFGAIGSSIFGAGERQLFNGRPHYGTDSGAFGERLGAAELNQVTESFLSYGLYAAMFHEDPHYYVMGPGVGHGIMHRAAYSASRVILTRADSGNTGVNWAKLAGMGSATVLTNAYYPPADREVAQTLRAYGASLATSVLTLELHEFMPDVMRLLHYKRQAVIPLAGD